MPETHIAPSPAHPTRMKLEPCSAEIRLTKLALGLDNIHYDVFLSPRFVDFTRKYLLDLIRQAVNISLLYGNDRKQSGSGAPEHSAFRKQLTEVLQESLTRAKFQQSIETDVLHQLALLKYFTQETGNQFSSLLVECKDWIRARGELFEHSEQAHVMRSKIAEVQADRKNVVRQVGDTLCRVWREVEESAIVKSRRALFGEDFHEMYDLLQNRFLFVEGGNDDHLFLEHYVLLGNFMNDPDRFDVFDALLLDFVREFVLTGDNVEELGKARKTHERLLEQARLLRSELVRIEQEQEELAGKAGESGDVFPWLFKRKTGVPAEAQAEIEDLRRKFASLEQNLEELAPQIDAAKQRMDFIAEEYKSRLGDYLNQPENARRLFDAQAPSGEGEASPETRAQLLEEWVHRLEERDLLFHVLASYELRKIYRDYAPPIHLQQLKKAIVSRDEAKRVTAILEQFPARKISMKKLEEASRAIRRVSHEDSLTIGLQFAEDLMRLRRDRRNYQQVVGWMERINLVRSERSRELSRVNKSLYEFSAPGGRAPGRRSGDQSHRDQSGCARVDRSDERSSIARDESSFAFQHEFARASEEAARAVRRGEGVHRGRCDHFGNLRDGIDARDAASCGAGVRAGSRNSGRDAGVQHARENNRVTSTGIGSGRSVPGFRAVDLDGRRFENHDFTRAESFRQAFELCESGAPAVCDESCTLQRVSAADADGRHRGGRRRRASNSL